MNTIMLIQATAATCLKESSKVCCCHNLSWREVVLYGILIGAITYVIKLIMDWNFKNKSMTTQREYDLEDRKWKHNKDLTDKLIDHLKTNEELNDKYVEDLERLIGIRK